MHSDTEIHIIIMHYWLVNSLFFKQFFFLNFKTELFYNCVTAGSFYLR